MRYKIAIGDSKFDIEVGEIRRERPKSPLTAKAIRSTSKTLPRLLPQEDCNREKQ